ncbi:hypothetical protein DL96DRAFT_1701914 [Flagelloscypha sp. PMI_526]|nr:hypothetical protein DL96DRAFT_1701914 [Flagelloscypha sp. PMI_526]
MSHNPLAGKDGEGKLLLSLDTGWLENPGVISQVYIVEDILHAYEFDKDLPEDSVKSYEVFDMISFGGDDWSPQMTARAALAAFLDLHKSVFSQPDSHQSKSGGLDVRLSTPISKTLRDNLFKAIQQLVEQQLGKDGLSLKMKDIEGLIPGCKFAITAMTSTHVAAPTVFRGYRSRTPSPDCTLVDALRATLADPSFFSGVTFGQPVPQTYIAATGYPNPIETLLQDVEATFRSNSIATILSIGSGRQDPIAIDGPTDFPQAMIKLASSAQATSERISDRFSHYPEAYYRFDVDNLQPLATSSPASVEAASHAYLAQATVSKQRDALILLMVSGPSTVKVEDISRAKPGGLARDVREIPIMVSTYDNIKTLSYADRASFNRGLVCLEGTRTHILSVIFTWMVEPKTTPSVLWLEGVLGAGKSYIAHSVAVEADRLGILASSFFMTPGTGIRECADQRSVVNDPPSLKNIVTSLIVDLGGLSDAFRWAAGEILKQRPRLATATPSAQLTEFLLPSLTSLPKHRTFLWIIDGFDELMRYSDRDAADNFFRDLCSSIPMFPQNFMVFVTSRPLPNHPLPQLHSIHHLMLDLLSPENTQDLDLISYSELERIANGNRAFSIPPQGQQLAAAFRRKAGGHPLWLRVVREYLLTSLTPNEELEELVTIGDSGPSDYHQLMNATYTQVIARSINLNNSKNRKTLKLVVFVLLALQRPLSLATLLNIFDGSTEMPVGTFKLVTSHLRPLLLGTDNEDPLEFIHLSLRDFFISSTSFGDIIQDTPTPRDLSSGHFALIKSSFQVMETYLCPDVHFDNYPRDHPALNYVVAAWPKHIAGVNADIHSSELATPLSTFLDRSFIVWLEFHSTIGLPFLFTQDFLAEAECFAKDIWAKVVCRRETAEMLDKLRSRFEKFRRFNDQVLCSNQAVALWRRQAVAMPLDQRGLYLALEHQAQALGELGLTREALAASEEAIMIYRQMKTHQEPNPTDLPYLLSGMSKRLSNLGRHAEVLTASEEAISLYRPLVRRYPNCFEPYLALLLINFSDGLSGAGRHVEALNAIEESVFLRRQLAHQDPSVFQDKLALSLTSFSNCLSRAGRHVDAVATIDEAVMLYRQLVKQRPKEFEAKFAHSLTTFSTHLSAVGRHFEAINAIEEAVLLRKQLVQQRPKVFEADLALSLTNFSNCLSRSGRHADALTAIEEAVALRRQLVQQNPGIFEAKLARSLISFSYCLSEAGRHAGALTSIEEAVLLYRQLMHQRPTLFKDDLARSLTNFSNRLSKANRHAEALSTIEEAVLLRRQLVQQRPKVFEASLAISLSNLSNRLSEAGRHTEALATIEEAVLLYRQLVHQRPKVFEADLAHGLTNLSNRLLDAGHSAEALKAVDEGVSIYRQLAQQRSKVFEVNLAFSLTNFSNHLSDAGEHAEALSAIEEAVSLYQQLAQQRPKVYEAKLATSMVNFSNRLSKVGCHAEALNVIEEAVSLRKRLVQQRPNVFEGDLALSLVRFSNCLSQAGRQTDALAVFEEAVSLYRQLVQQRPAVFMSELALSLTNISTRLVEVGRHVDALTTIEESVSLYRQVVQHHPKIFEAELAHSLTNFSIRLSKAGRHADALDAIEEAVGIRRQLVQQRPKTFEAKLAHSLTNFSKCLSETDRLADALAAVEEAVSLYRQVIQEHPKVFEGELAFALTCYSNHLSDVGRQAEALPAIEEAVSLYRQLVQQSPDVWEVKLAPLLMRLSNHLSEAGRLVDALTTIEDAVTLYRQLVQKRPRVFEPVLSLSLADFSYRLSESGQHAGALAAIEEAVSLRKQLIQEYPEVFEADLALSLTNLSDCLLDADRSLDALVAIEEAVCLYRQLVQQHPTFFEADLALSLTKLSNHLSGAGRDTEALAAVEEAILFLPHSSSFLQGNIS